MERGRREEKTIVPKGVRLMAMQWRDELATGVEQIDRQHQELIARVNGLLAACWQGKGKAEVAETLAFLGDYVVTHFADEEKLQQEAGYPDLAAHKALHEQFIADYGQLVQEFERTGATVGLVVKVNRVVVDWLVQHISRVDKAFAEFYRTRG